MNLSILGGEVDKLASPQDSSSRSGEATPKLRRVSWSRPRSSTVLCNCAPVVLGRGGPTVGKRLDLFTDETRRSVTSSRRSGTRR